MAINIQDEAAYNDGVGLDWALIEKITNLDLAKFNELKERLGSI